jgi:hypothetical protein
MAGYEAERDIGPLKHPLRQPSARHSRERIVKGDFINVWGLEDEDNASIRDKRVPHDYFVR